MPSTVILDADVESRLARLKDSRPFNDLVNDVIRFGLGQMEIQPSMHPYSMVTVSGEPLRTDLDNTFELMAELDGRITSSLSKVRVGWWRQPGRAARR
jgi:hypothetical protein